MTIFKRRSLHEHLRELACQVLPSIREDGATIWGAEKEPAVRQHPTTFFQNIHQLYLYLAAQDDLSAADREAFLRAGLANLAYALTLVDENANLESWHAGNHNLGAYRAEWHAFAVLLSLESLDRDGLAGSLRDRAIAYLERYGELEAEGIRTMPERPTTREFCSNHFLWRLTLVHRLGRYFDRPDWRDLANTVYWDEVLPAQSPDGCWNEFGYPTSKYHHIHTSAIGQHWLLEQDHAGEREAVARSLDFCRHWSYPDGTAIETIDGRVIHQPHVQPMFCPAYVLWPEGQAYLQECFERHIAGRPLATAEGLGCLVWLGFFAHGLPESLPDFSAAPAPLPEVIRLRSQPAARVNQGPWTAVACGFSRPFTHARFCTDFQNYISLHHRDLGLLIGGGHSKRDPWCSTFAQTAGGSQYLCLRCLDLDFTHDLLRLRLNYGEHDLEVQIRLIDDWRVDLTGIWLTVAEGSAWEFGFTMPSRPGNTWQFDHEPPVTLDDTHRVNKLKLPGQGDIEAVYAGKVALSLAGIGNIRWPQLAYQPYGTLPWKSLADAWSRVSVPLTVPEPRQTIRLRLIDQGAMS